MPWLASHFPPLSPFPMPLISCPVQLLRAGAVSHYARSVPCQGGLDLGGGTNGSCCRNNKYWRDKELWSQRVSDVSLFPSGCPPFTTSASRRTAAWLWEMQVVSSMAASHSTSSPSLRPRSSPHWSQWQYSWQKYIGSGLVSSTLSSTVLTSTHMFGVHWEPDEVTQTISRLDV